MFFVGGLFVGVFVFVVFVIVLFVFVLFVFVLFFLIFGGFGLDFFFNLSNLVLMGRWLIFILVDLSVGVLVVVNLFCVLIFLLSYDLNCLIFLSKFVMCVLFNYGFFFG